MGFYKRYSIPEIPPSNNKFIGRTNRWDYQNEKKKWAQFVQLYCVPKPSNPIQRAKITLVYHFKDERRRDPDNYSGKMLLDGLVKAGIIADDSFFHIELHIRANYDDKTGVTEIFVDDLDGERF